MAMSAIGENEESIKILLHLEGNSQYGQRVLNIFYLPKQNTFPRQLLRNKSLFPFRPLNLLLQRKGFIRNYSVANSRAANQWNKIIWTTSYLLPVVEF